MLDGSGIGRRSSVWTWQIEGMLRLAEDRVELTRRGLQWVDQLQPEFYDSKCQNARYSRKK